MGRALERRNGANNIPYIYRDSRVAKRLKFFELQKNGLKIFKTKKATFFKETKKMPMHVLSKYVLKKSKGNKMDAFKFKRKRKYMKMLFDKGNKKKRLCRQRKFFKKYLFLLKKQGITIFLL